MRTPFSSAPALPLIAALLLLTRCVYPYDPGLPSAVNVVVVDGTITNLDEPQLVRLSRSQSVSGRDGNAPIAGAQVEVVVDSVQVLALAETAPGTYQLPAGFRGQPGHSYQLRFRLTDGTRYASSQQVMPAPVPIAQVSAQFNANSLPPQGASLYTRGHDFFLDVRDPAGERNYYKWDWVLYEKQDWCHTCYQGLYAVYNVYSVDDGIYLSGNEPYEDCFAPPPFTVEAQLFRNRTYDYNCRTGCWAILYSHGLNLFDDALTDGGLIQGREVAQIPYYQRRGSLVVIRQLALTPEAHQFYRLVETQTQKTGGLVDTPPAPPVGNVQNTANDRENVVGFFTAAGLSTFRYWLTRQDADGPPWGLFEGLNGRSPEPEPAPPFAPTLIQGGPPRPPTALCVPGPNRTPIRPEGWQD